MLSDFAMKPALVTGRNGLFPGEVRLLGPNSDLGDVCSLRYRAYRDAGWISHRNDEKLRDHYDRLPGTLNLAAYKESGCVCAFRFTADEGDEEPNVMPFESMFPDVLASLKDRGLGKIAEMGRLAVAPDMPNPSFRSTLVMSMIRSASVLCYATDVDYTVVAVHKRLSRFYRSMFAFEFLAESDEYNEITEPTHLLGRPLKAEKTPQNTRNRFFVIDEAEMADARATIAALRSAGEASTFTRTASSPASSSALA